MGALYKCTDDISFFVSTWLNMASRWAQRTVSLRFQQLFLPLFVFCSRKKANRNFTELFAFEKTHQWLRHEFYHLSTHWRHSRGVTLVLHLHSKLSTLQSRFAQKSICNCLMQIISYHDNITISLCPKDKLLAVETDWGSIPLGAVPQLALLQVPRRRWNEEYPSEATDKTWNGRTRGSHASWHIRSIYNLLVLWKATDNPGSISEHPSNTQEALSKKVTRGCEGPFPSPFWVPPVPTNSAKC